MKNLARPSLLSSWLPCLEEFTLNPVHYPEPDNAGLYAKGPRYFHDFAAPAIIMK